MKILQVMAAKGNGGAEIYSTDVIKSLHEMGVEQCAVMLASAPRRQELEQCGLRVVPEVLRSPLRPLQRWSLRQLVEREKPDIVHCWMRRAGNLVAWIPQGPAPVVGWCGDYEEIRHFPRCTHFVGVTQEIVDSLITAGLASSRAQHIPTFPSIIELPALDRASLDTPQDAKVLLTLSRLHPSKGLDVMIQALTHLPDVVLWLAGEGPLRSELESLAQSLGVSARVRFLGWRTDRGPLLQAADVCVLPSRYEPFGTVLLEAWSTRTPFIACSAAGPKAYVKSGVNGMLAPTDDAATLAQVIRQVLDDAELRRTIVEHGYSDYIAAFTRDAVMQRWIQYYENLMRWRP